MVIKFLHWNIWFKEKIENILKQIKELNPDVICLNELAIGLDFNDKIDTGKHIAQNLNLSRFAKEYMDWKNDAKQLVLSGIFSKYKFDKTHFLYSSKLKKEEGLGIMRGSVYLEADIDIEGKKITFATDHLLYYSGFKENDIKIKEIDTLTKIIESKKNQFIFSGDFNAPPNSYTINQIKKYLTLIGPSETEKTAFTKDGDKPDYAGWKTGFEWRLDYVFATKDMKVKSAKIIKTEYSDHLPILVEFEV